MAAAAPENAAPVASHPGMEPMTRTARRLPLASPTIARICLGFAALTLGAATRSAEGAALSAGAARVSYEVAGSVGTEGMDGAPAVRFVPAGGEVDPASPFALGSFAVDPPSAGGATTYRQTPVTIELWARAIGGTPTAGPGGAAADPIVVHGWLSGTAGGTGPAALAVLFDQGIQPDDPRFYQPRPLPPFPAGSALGAAGMPPAFLGLNGGRSMLTLDSTAGASTPIPAELTLAPSVPEPAVPLILAGLGLALAAGRVVEARSRAAR